MGYPMWYLRMLRRNGLTGEDPYESSTSRSIIADDLRRVEEDQRDPAHLKAYARIAGITPVQAKRVLDAFFGDRAEYPEFGDEMMFAWLNTHPEDWDSKIGQFYAERYKEIYGE